MTGRETVGTQHGSDPEEGPRVGLASYDLRDPEATFRLIEPYRPATSTRRAGFGAWSVRILLSWSVNLVALAAAGLIVTNVGPYDPSAYVAWAAVFGLVNASTPVSARLTRRPLAAVVNAGVLLAVDVALVWLMTRVVRPFHSPDLVAIVKVGAVMWVANLPLAVLSLRRREPAPRRQPT